MNNESKNYYEVLEIDHQANHEEIHSAYIRAKNAYGGDSLALYSLLSEDEANKVLDLIEEAYTILSDPVKRKQYNEVRGIETIESNHHQAQLAPQQPTQEEKKIDVNVERKVAKNKYALDFVENEQFEKEIEQCSEYTGDFLKQIREYKKVDINRLAEMTKISKTYLTYIEEEAVGKLPAPVYTRGFVYQYAKCLKLNPDLVCSSYMTRLKTLKENL